MNIILGEPKFKTGDAIKVVSGDHAGKSGKIYACTPIKFKGEVRAYEYTVNVNDPRGGKIVSNSMTLNENQLVKS